MVRLVLGNKGGRVGVPSWKDHSDSSGGLLIVSLHLLAIYSSRFAFRLIPAALCWPKGSPNWPQLTTSSTCLKDLRFWPGVGRFHQMLNFDNDGFLNLLLHNFLVFKMPTFWSEMTPHPLRIFFENSSISEKKGFPKEGILATDATRHPKLLKIGPNHGCHAYRYSCCKGRLQILLCGFCP